MKLKKVFLLYILLCFSYSIMGEPPHNWKSHSMVAREVIKKYEDFKTYKANFTIKTKNKFMQGIAYYMQPGRVRFEFTQPYGDLLISDGKILWIVVGKQNLIGKQDLTLNVKNEDNKPIFAVMPGRGIKHLFNDYHYKFDDINQPKEIDGKKYYVLDLEQKVKIGGYERMQLYINAENFFIEKAIAEGSFGTKTTIEFSNIQTNIELEGKLFQYKPPENARIVLNPLVSEE
ncbi:MAG: membrane protein [Leptospiraceae bacterium]|nr:MAG: membrane protein [Leptospiraceae bacterium]